MVGCEETFKNEKELKRKICHCGNETKPYNNARNEEIIDRIAYRGIGIPNATYIRTTTKYDTTVNMKHGNAKNATKK